MSSCNQETMFKYVLFSASVGAIVTIAIFRLWPKKRKNQTEEKIAPPAKEHFAEVIFFPDDKIDDSTTEESTGMQYKTLLGSSRPFRRLRSHFADATESIDICLFLVTSQDMAKAVLDRIAKGVRVRLITDDANVRLEGSQVTEFIRKGAFVYHKPSLGKNLMHHKFALIDGKRLVTGSFNWTMKVRSK